MVLVAGQVVCLQAPSVLWRRRIQLPSGLVVLDALARTVVALLGMTACSVR